MTTTGEKGPRRFWVLSPLMRLSRRFTFVAIVPLGMAVWVASLLGIGMNTAAWFKFGLFPFIAFAVLYAVVAQIPGRLTVYDDGIRTRWMGRSRFVRFEDLDRVDVNQKILGRSRQGHRLRRSTEWIVLTAVRLHAKTGKKIAIGLEREVDDVHGAATEDAIGDFVPLSAKARAIKELIEQRFAATQRAGDDASAERLRRGDRDLRAWLADAAASGRTEGGGYRAAEIPTEVLWQALENPAAEASVRVGAAVALRPGCDAAGVERIRVVVDGCGTETVRAALTEVAKGAIDVEATDRDPRIRALDAVR